MNKIRKVFKTLDYDTIRKYHRYWGRLTVKDNADYFRRWLFAFCSVHTTWEANVNGYNAIKNFTTWLGDDEALLGYLKTGRCGLYNNRTTYISAFANDFWSNPSEFYRGQAESWRQMRDRLSTRIKGLGLAKTSFALEMSFPTEVEVVCLDIHMLRLYGDEDAGRKPSYYKYEADWIGRSTKVDTPPYITRLAYWDKLQGHKNSRYWSKCLEC